MKKLMLTALICFGLAVAPVVAQEGKIGYVDLQKALNMSEAGKAAKEEIKAKVESYDAEVKAKQEQLKKLKADLEKQAVLLSEDARSAKEREYQQKLKDYQRFTKDIQEELQQEDADFTRAIIEDLLKVVQELGKQQGYTVILERTESAMLYGDESVDLTDDLIKAFNQQ
ncbi:MAG TPA: OmpH family outer membrane protein [Desulfuromonadales bacterium]|nr:OmpH family outer membrane protein [Desulfuromonadales bacterium]